MSRETEFIARHKEDCRKAAELCRALQYNLVEISPRTQKYLALMQISKRLEGTARQMAHERGDDFRWLSMGNHYFKVGEAIRKYRNAQNWMKFGDIAKIFEIGIVKIDRLALAATGLSSRSVSPLLILPAHLQHHQQGGIIH